MIIVYVGGMGSGKTLSAVREAYQYHLKGLKVLSNMKLSFPHQFITSKDIIEFAKQKQGLYNCVVVLDEMHIFLDSRRSVSKKNLISSYFITQTRKQKVKLIGTTQHRHQLDKRVRDNTDAFIDCEKVEIPYTFDGEDILIVYNYINTRNRNSMDRFIGNKYFNLYDTEEIIFDSSDLE